MLDIEIFSDVICPWCFIGKRRLDRVLADGLGTTVQLRWRPFQLYPNLPVEGVDRGELLRRRYGAGADPGRIPERIAVEAAEEDIDLRFDLIQRTPNTMLAHRLMEYAFDQDERMKGLQHRLAEALFLAYFCEGRDVGDLDTLVDIAAAQGVERDAARTQLQSDAGRVEVEAQLKRAPELGITGVPGYFLAGSFLLPGAQTAETMAQILNRVQAKLA